MRSVPDPYWVSEFRRRMIDFSPTTPAGMIPISIKMRIGSGCFHRPHSPFAYRLIDQHLANGRLHGHAVRLEEHETGPEILAYAAMTTAGLTLAKSVVDLIVVVLKAREEGLKRGDAHNDPLEIIIRRVNEKGEYQEEKLLRLPPGIVEDADRVVRDFFRQVAPSDKKKPRKPKKTRQKRGH